MNRPLLFAGREMRGEAISIGDVFFNLQENRHEIDDAKREQDSRDARQNQHKCAAMPYHRDIRLIGWIFLPARGARRTGMELELKG